MGKAAGTTVGVGECMQSNEALKFDGIPRLSLPGIDLRDTISFDSNLSSGVNRLPSPQLYRTLGMSYDEKMVRNYTQTSGTPVLCESIKLFENMCAYEGQPCQTPAFEHICITAGATAAITFFLSIFL